MADLIHVVFVPELINYDADNFVHNMILSSSHLFLFVWLLLGP